MAAIALTSGQSEALSELREIVRINGGRITVDSVRDPQRDGWPIEVDLVIDCRGETTDGSSTRLEDWESVTIYIPAQFPFEHPDVTVPHRRFVGLPHVIWADSICLYLAANDWDPARRMHGFVSQLLTWFAAVASGTITSPDIPWHAPLTQRRTGEYLTVRTDLPDSLENDRGVWLAFALIEWVGGPLYEVQDWLGSPAQADLIRAWREYRGTDNDADSARRIFVATLIALPEPIGIAYPDNRQELLTALADQGLRRHDYDEALEFSRAFNEEISDDGQAPELLLLGAPAANQYAIPSRIAHIAAWALGVDQEAPDAVHWMRVFDQRPRISTRRDAQRPTHWLAGKRVIVLGCGALGAPTAEFCVRAGAAETHVVDYSVVRPGVLVRQPYTYVETGCSKAFALAARLSLVDPDALVLPVHDDATALINAGGLASQFDLIIDATANRSVAGALELTRWVAGQLAPPLLSMMVGHDCERGAATLALPGASGSGVDILRRLAITASTDPALYDVLDDFFPDHPRGVLFQPEPGCSDPTFTGSAADLAAFAGQLFNDAMAILSSAKNADSVAFPQRWASVVRTFAVDSTHAPRQRLSWANDQVRPDYALHYQIRIEPAALASMRREAALMANRGGPHLETGGLLLGQIDHASRVVWITEADGPPPGSIAHSEGLALDPTQARASARHRRRLTRGMVAYVGAWHTHPYSLALPSTQDETAMNQMAGDGTPVLLMILGGSSDRMAHWIADNQLPDMHLQLYFPGAEERLDASVLE